MALWFSLELNLILNDIAVMPCNENTYIEDISLHLISFDLFGLSVIACRQLFWVKSPCKSYGGKWVTG
jgi:hypothetical protein